MILYSENNDVGEISEENAEEINIHIESLEWNERETLLGYVQVLFTIHVKM